MGGHARSLAPDLAHLARELGAWCEREAAARATAAAPPQHHAKHHANPRTPMTKGGGGGGVGQVGIAATPARTPARGSVLAAGAVRTPAPAAAAAKSSRKPMSAIARRQL